MSSKEKFGAYNLLVYGERLPTHLVQEVVVNPLASDILHRPSQRIIATKVGILEHTFLMVPKELSDVGIYSPPNWTRTVTLDRDYYPYSDFVGNVLTGKGVTATGKDYLNDYKGSKSAPWGFFGHRDAAKDMEISNELLQHGARVALPLGYVVMRTDQVIEWIQSHWSGPSQGSRLSALDKVVGNGDMMAYYLRIGGSEVRLGTDNVTNSYVRSEMKKVAAATLQEEGHSRQVKTFFERLLRDNDAISLNFDGFVAWFSSNARRNVEALEQMQRENVYYKSLGDVMSHEKDICLGLFHQDFEEASYYKKGSKCWMAAVYRQRMESILKKYLKRMYACYNFTTVPQQQLDLHIGDMRLQMQRH